ncbi:hypothetical protein SK069_05920 [Patulibacter brassicae]|uniref:Uncharacterized protein n=1 Tax=Patulibacter brassicae TaxID=1705717 RepID=A0ABU4VH21_9ACTN|nr:hypothetical protein [Patulibacter brassicae]MDX8151122.1 hypothetical protein [Patulibacter brassicae]
MSGRYSLDYVREKYGVPVKRGQRVRVSKGRGAEGVVTSGDAQYVRVRLDGEKRSGRYHPLDLDYGDGVAPQDRLDAHNAAIDAWNARLRAAGSGRSQDTTEPEADRG